MADDIKMKELSDANRYQKTMKGTGADAHLFMDQGVEENQLYFEPSESDQLTRGGIYYSKTMPQGSGKIDKTTVDKYGKPLLYNEEMWNQMIFARDNNVKPEELDKVTDYLVGIGYLDKDDPRNYDDKFKNREWYGAIKRYQYNFSDDTMPMPWGKPFEAVKRWMKLDDENSWGD
tara:strand:+ start:935 stop:1459 length:525 start_codon:yes stop_codon:yes gene_type:complete